MDGLHVRLHDDVETRSDFSPSPLALLLRRPDLEIMRQTLEPHSLIWLSPAEDASMVEYFYVLEGRLTVSTSSEEERTLAAGDSFYAEGLVKDCRIVAQEHCELLYIVNRPVFDSLCDFQKALHELLEQIDSKDKVTLKHSLNVLDYSILLLQELGDGELSFDEMASAALFHDVGKCAVPDEVLKKEGKLTPEEYNCMKGHSSHSYDLLLPYYGERVAATARDHHERLDGSGYPHGKRGEAICLGARIIAVADSFDAMTSVRSYNHVKLPELAAAELIESPQRYDARICAALQAMVRRGKLPRKS